MSKYKQFDQDLKNLKIIEDKLKRLSEQKDNISLDEVMQLRDEALKLHSNCNSILKEI